MKTSDIVKTNFDHIVSSKHYTTKLKALDGSSILTVHTENISSATKRIITRGQDWLVLFADFGEGRFFLKNKKTQIPINGSKAILIPPFEFVNLYLPEGVFERYELYLDSLQLSQIFNGPVMIPWDSQSVPTDKLELATWINSHRDSIISVEESKPSRVAKTAKSYIESNYKAQLKISDISRHLEVNRSYMTKSFIRSYGFSPLYWRQVIRMFDAIKAFNNGEDITKSIYASGYTSITQYLLFFKKWFDVTPKRYRIPKK
jgi:AraC-like DNA-binding protein